MTPPRFTAAAAAFLLTSSASPSVVVTPITLQTVLKTAKAGDTIVLAAGDYGDVQIPRGDYNPAININASAARFRSIVIRSTKGVHLRGGSVTGSPEQFHGILIDTAGRIVVSGLVVSGARVGISLINSTDVEITGNRLDGIRSDGINLAMVQRVRVTGNQCLNFHPIPAQYDIKGKMLKDGDHPDCIQGWSRSTYTPTSDIFIEGNTAYGHMQGITFFDPRQGGYDRITIRGNNLTLDYWHGIAVYEGRDTIIIGNRVHTIPGARAPNFPYPPVRTWILTQDGTNQRICGNIVPAMPGGEGTKKC